MSELPITTPKILSGRVIRAEKVALLTEKVKALPQAPTLAIIQIGDRADSTVYIKAKKTFAEQIGVQVRHIHFPENVSAEEIISNIKECNADRHIQGIIVQLPLPARIEVRREEIISTIDPRKDIDGLTETNQKLLQENNQAAIIPATARGVKELLEYYKIDLKDKKVVVVGRSALVGTPIARVCTNEGAQVTVCHSKTINLAEEARKADILIVAVGKAGLIGRDHVVSRQIIIDVGINRTLDGVGDISLEGVNSKTIGKGAILQGDVDFDAVKDTVAAITPVPGGIGQMTVLALFENLIDACNK